MGAGGSCKRCIGKACKKLLRCCKGGPPGVSAYFFFSSIIYFGCGGFTIYTRSPIRDFLCNIPGQLNQSTKQLVGCDNCESQLLMCPKERTFGRSGSCYAKAMNLTYLKHVKAANGSLMESFATAAGEKTCSFYVGIASSPPDMLVKSLAAKSGAISSDCAKFHCQVMMEALNPEDKSSDLSRLNAPCTNVWHTKQWSHSECPCSDVSMSLQNAKLLASELCSATTGAADLPGWAYEKILSDKPKCMQDAVHAAKAQYSRNTEAIESEICESHLKNTQTMHGWFSDIDFASQGNPNYPSTVPSGCFQLYCRAFNWTLEGESCNWAAKPLRAVESSILDYVATWCDTIIVHMKLPDYSKRRICGRLSVAEKQQLRLLQCSTIEPLPGGGGGGPLAGGGGRAAGQNESQAGGNGGSGGAVNRRLGAADRNSSNIPSSSSGPISGWLPGPFSAADVEADVEFAIESLSLHTITVGSAGSIGPKQVLTTPDRLFPINAIPLTPLKDLVANERRLASATTAAPGAASSEEGSSSSLDSSLPDYDESQPWTQCICYQQCIPGARYRKVQCLHPACKDPKPATILPCLCADCSNCTYVDQFLFSISLMFFIQGAVALMVAMSFVYFLSKDEDDLASMNIIEKLLGFLCKKLPPIVRFMSLVQFFLLAFMVFQTWAPVDFQSDCNESEMLRIITLVTMCVWLAQLVMGVLARRKTRMPAWLYAPARPGGVAIMRLVSKIVRLMGP